MMPSGYIHQGIISANAVLEDSRIHLDPEARIADAFYHPPDQLGNMEIWYADVYDPANDSVFVVQFTYGPDSLKKESVVFISFHAYTPDQGVTSLTRRIPVEQLHVNEDPYQVTVGESLIRGHKHPDSGNTEYHIHVTLEHIRMDVIIEPVVNTWLPLGEKLTFHDRDRKGVFSWIPSITKGKVNGSVTIGKSIKKLTDAHGYYDHTYWETGTQQPFHSNPLFWDDILVRWVWLKIIHDDIKIAVNEFRFRPWLNNRNLSSFLVCKDDSIILSCNAAAQIKRMQSTPDQPFRKAGEFSLSFSGNDLDLKLEITPTELLSYQDMLEHTHPLSRPLVRMFFGNPLAFYTLALVHVTMSFGTENLVLTNAMALYEPMVLNTRPSRFEDRIRKFISRKLSRRI
jgi:hypothetical protein